MSVRSFESFYRDEFRSVVAMAIAFTSDAQVAEDIAQEAFMAAHRRWDRVSQYATAGRGSDHTGPDCHRGRRL